MDDHNKPEDMSELNRWITNPVTQWFFAELLKEFDPHKRIAYAKPGDLIDELKGEENVMKFIRNPGELM